MSISENPLSPEERQRRFISVVNGYPDDAQGVIADFSSMMLEPDVAKEIRGSRTEILAFRGQLASSGLEGEQVVFVCNHFGLPDPTAQRRP